MELPTSRRWSFSDDDYEFDSDCENRYFRPSNRNRNRSFESDREIISQEDKEQGTWGKMSSWFHNHASSHQTQLAATAVLSGAAVAGAIFGYQAMKRQEAVRDLKESIPEVNERHHTEKVGLVVPLAWSLNVS